MEPGRRKYVVPFVGPVMMWSPKARMVVLRRVNSLDSPKLPQCGSGKADYPERPHSCSPPPWLDEKWLSVSFSSRLTPPACRSSTQEPRRCSGPARRRPSQHREAMRACRDLRVRASRNGANSGDFLKALTCHRTSLHLPHEEIAPHGV